MISPPQAEQRILIEIMLILNKTRINLRKKNEKTGQDRKKDKKILKDLSVQKRTNLLKKDTWVPCNNRNNLQISTPRKYNRVTRVITSTYRYLALACGTRKKWDRCPQMYRYKPVYRNVHTYIWLSSMIHAHHYTIRIPTSYLVPSPYLEFRFQLHLNT